jgi:hypothetical protein
MPDNPARLPAPEIIPPKSGSLSFREKWTRAGSAEKVFTFFISGSALLTLFTFCISQFFQIRGVQQMMTSRVFLIGAWLVLVAGTWGLAWARWYEYRKRITLTVALVSLLAMYLMDQAFPMPKAVIESTKRTPLITVRIHPSAFPVSVPPRTTLHILPLHPFQVFTDAGSQLHEYDNECSTDRPWPSEKEISSKPANSYEEVRSVEITNHGPGTMESGRVSFSVRYNKSFAGGCTVPPESAQIQNDVISIPTLDQGQTFAFVSVNQTDGCAWLLPPDTMRMKMVGDDNAADVPVKLEAINVPNWVGTPFGPTAVKWEGVPTKNPGYGMVRSGAACESPKRSPDRGELERETQRRKSANKDKLADLLQDSTALKNKCFSAQSIPIPNFSCEAEFYTWMQRSAATLSTMERSYKARFDAATGLNYSWPSVSDPNVETIINTLNHKADVLKELIKEQQ